MIIKRAFYALLVLMLMPLVAQAQSIIPTPAHGTAVISVSKFFGNSAEDGRPGRPFVGVPVTFRIQCDGGSISPSEAVEIFPEFGQNEVSFVIFNLGPGQTTECRVWEEPIDGYTPAYDCDFRNYSGFNGAGPDNSCLITTSPVECKFNTISANTNNDFTASPGSQAGCAIFNDVDPVEVEVTKTWEVFGQPGADFSDGATIRIRCNAPLYDYDNQVGNWYGKQFNIGEGSYVDGMATVTAEVYPEWYPDGDTTMCYAVEDNLASAVESESDCGSQQMPAMSVPIGSSGVGCTINNTVFFEGIPSLNQYGMALMALLMLGVGFVGFRRFV